MESTNKNTIIPHSSPNFEIASDLLYKVVQNFTDQYKSKYDLRNDLMVLLVIILFVENKFSPTNNEGAREDLKTFLTPENLSTLTSGTNNVYTVRFFLEEFEVMPIRIIFSPLGDTMIINALIEDSILDTFAICLHMNRYVVSPDTEGVHVMFKNLEFLSVEVKDKILIPITSRILFYNGLPSPSLNGLPVEISKNILQFLSLEDILNLKETCWRFRVLIDKDIVWQSLYIRDFKDTPIDTDMNWKDNYKRAYKLVKSRNLVL